MSLYEIGTPYRWVQWLCGLQFLDVSEKSRKDVPFSQHGMDRVMSRLKARIRVRIALHKQVTAFGKCGLRIM